MRLQCQIIICDKIFIHKSFSDKELKKVIKNHLYIMLKYL